MTVSSFDNILHVPAALALQAFEQVGLVWV